MAKPSNLLILDEPTNDLDIETLDLLQEVLNDYDGTVILVSHDRDFLDRVATLTIAMEGDGRATPYAGGWTDMMDQREGRPLGATDLIRNEAPRPAPAVERSARPKPAPARKPSLSFTERHRLDALPAEIDRLMAEIAKLSQLLADADLFTREPVKFRKASEMLAERQAVLAAFEEEWLELAEKADG
jgi:ATP-binding cassette subfamily F protein uup